MLSLNDYTIKQKILGLTISIALGIASVIGIVLVYSSESISHKIEERILDDTKKNVSTVVHNIYNSCQVADQLFINILTKKLNESKSLIKKNGGISLSGEIINWNATNQVSKDPVSIVLPKMMIGGKWLGYNTDFSNYQMIVDDMAEENYTFTIFQRMNDKGDMLRIATNVKLDNGTRAIGTYIPAENPDGTKNPVLASVLSGSTYLGNAFVVNDYYQSIYEPIRDNSGKIIGMIYTGVSLKSADKLRESILKTVIGKTGYVYVLGGSGARKGYYIISKDGKRDGENIYDAKDASGEFVIRKIIEQSTSSKPGEVSFIEYFWKNAGDKEAKKKIVALAYFKQFDWVIGAGTNFEEIEESSLVVHNGFNQIYLYISIALLISLIGIIFTSIYITNKIAYPIKKSMEIMNMIAHGKIKESISEISTLENWYYK